MKTKAKILIQEKFLIVDNAIDYKRYNKDLLSVIFRINDLDINHFNYEYTNASAPDVFEKVKAHKNILVTTTFTTIKSYTIEDLLRLAIEQELKDKKIFSLMSFKIVGSDFENYKDEITKLEKNNVHFYFISEKFSQFNKYEINGKR